MKFTQTICLLSLVFAALAMPLSRTQASNTAPANTFFSQAKFIDGPFPPPDRGALPQGAEKL